MNIVALLLTMMMMMMINMMIQELPATVQRLLGTADYLLHSLLPSEGECGSVKQRLTTIERRIEDLTRLFAVRHKNITLAAQFYSLAQVVRTSELLILTCTCT